MDDNTAININEDEVLLSEEMINTIIEREKYIEQNPDCWISYEQAMRELRNV